MSLPIHLFDAGDFPELEVLQRLVERGTPLLRSDVVGEIPSPHGPLPLYCLELGSSSVEHPAIGFFGGVHGVERIGTQILLAYLHSLIERLGWDDSLSQLLRHVRLVFMPIINPGGMRARTRANLAGVDLMRNAPVEAEDSPLLLGGHRLSRHLPWYRGPLGAPMQPEASALCEVVSRRLLPHPFSLSLDCHSGFGMHDRIWFPYAHTRSPVDCLPEIYALRTLFRSTHPYHGIYVIEPQSQQYMTHGDLWDYLYDQSAKPQQPYLPLTLELGSWMWVKKSPVQLFSTLGMFNPIATHRLQRTLRRHLTLFDFLLRATASYQRWHPLGNARDSLMQSAIAYWYSAGNPSQRHIA
jgi:hypothetical protein